MDEWLYIGVIVRICTNYVRICTVCFIRNITLFVDYQMYRFIGILFVLIVLSRAGLICCADYRMMHY